MGNHWTGKLLRNLAAFLEVYSLGEIDYDDNNQIIIYTGLIEDVETGVLREFTEQDEFV